MTMAMSRRNLLAVGTFALAGASSISATVRARTQATRGAANEEIVRRYYKAWEQKDWGPIDVLLAEKFTFTSANNDDHLSKSTFKTQCWQSQIDFIDHFELQRLMTQGDWAFVKYLCRTKNGRVIFAAWNICISQEKRSGPLNVTSVRHPASRRR